MPGFLSWWLTPLQRPAEHRGQPLLKRVYDEHLLRARVVPIGANIAALAMSISVAADILWDGHLNGRIISTVLALSTFGTALSLAASAALAARGIASGLAEFGPGGKHEELRAVPGTPRPLRFYLARAMLLPYLQAHFSAQTFLLFAPIAAMAGAFCIRDWPHAEGPAWLTVLAGGIAILVAVLEHVVLGLILKLILSASLGHGSEVQYLWHDDPLLHLTLSDWDSAWEKSAATGDGATSAVESARGVAGILGIWGWQFLKFMRFVAIVLLLFTAAMLVGCPIYRVAFWYTSQHMGIASAQEAAADVTIAGLMILTVLGCWIARRPQVILRRKD